MGGREGGGWREMEGELNILWGSSSEMIEGSGGISSIKKMVIDNVNVCIIIETAFYGLYHNECFC